MTAQDRPMTAQPVSVWDALLRVLLPDLLVPGRRSARTTIPRRRTVYGRPFGPYRRAPR